MGEPTIKWVKPEDIVKIKPATTPIEAEEKHIRELHDNVQELRKEQAFYSHWAYETKQETERALDHLCLTEKLLKKKFSKELLEKRRELAAVTKEWESIKRQIANASGLREALKQDEQAKPEETGE